MQARRFGFIGILVTLLIAGLAGVIGYNLGVNAGLAAAAAGSGTAPVVYAPWGFGGFGLFGFIFFILLILLVFAAFRRAAWGGGHHDGWSGRWAGPGEHDRRGIPPFADSMLQDWHRRAHDDEPPTDPRTSGQTGVA